MEENLNSNYGQKHHLTLLKDEEKRNIEDKIFNEIKIEDNTPIGKLTTGKEIKKVQVRGRKARSNITNTDNTDIEMVKKEADGTEADQIIESNGLNKTNDMNVVLEFKKSKSPRKKSKKVIAESNQKLTEGFVQEIEVKIEDEFIDNNLQVNNIDGPNKSQKDIILNNLIRSRRNGVNEKMKLMIEELKNNDKIDIKEKKQRTRKPKEPQDPNQPKIPREKRVRIPKELKEPKEPKEPKEKKAKLPKNEFITHVEYELNETVINLTELNNKTSISNTEMILAILEICLNKKNYFIFQQNNTRSFWNVVYEKTEWENILKKFQAETLRKYWRIIRDTNQFREVIELVHQYENEFNAINVK
jgi:hypothetical protein